MSVTTPVFNIISFDAAPLFRWLLFFRDILGQITNLVDDAKLLLRLRKHSLDRAREPSYVVLACDQNVLYTAVFQFIAYGRPKAVALIVGEKNTPNFFPTVSVDAQYGIRTFIYDPRLLARLENDAVKEDDRVDRTERPLILGH